MMRKASSIDFPMRFIQLHDCLLFLSKERREYDGGQSSAARPDGNNGCLVTIFPYEQEVTVICCAVRLPGSKSRWKV